MTLRQARKGRGYGAYFWGCLRFPHCRGTRDYDEEPLEVPEAPPPKPKAPAPPPPVDPIDILVDVGIPVGAIMVNPKDPEAGPARFLGCNESQIARYHLIWPNEPRQMRLKNSPYRRHVLFIGAPVEVDQEGQVLTGRVVERAEHDEGQLWRYVIETEAGELILDEAKVTPQRAETHSPIDQLEALSWRGGGRFAARWSVLQTLASWYADTDGIPALLGGRIRPMGHQLYAARRILWDRSPRFILADEVGLGKTIEAGLVAQSLLAQDPSLRVLVIAPGSMSRQWFCELYLRFGARPYVHIDAARIRESSHAEVLKLLRSDRLVVSTTALEAYPSVRKLLEAQKWGLVIVDEAHHYAPQSEFYQTLRTLSQQSYGFLALSATPSKRQLDSLLGLLALVAPEAYQPDQLEAFKDRYERQEEIWDVLMTSKNYIESVIKAGAFLEQDDLDFLVEEWEDKIEGDYNLERFVVRMRQGESEAADQLVAYVQEFHRLDHRLIRTRRSTVDPEHSWWSRREVEVVRYQASTDELVLARHFDQMPRPDEHDGPGYALALTLGRLACTTPQQLAGALGLRGASKANPGRTLEELESDPGPADEAHLLANILEKTPPLPGERRWLQAARELAAAWLEAEPVCGRFRAACDWIRDHLQQDSGHKVLVFSQEQSTVAAFYELLAQELGDNAVELFHYQLPDERLAQAALRFQRRTSCRVLVSDELGGEGRNFQMASAVLHLDTPYSVSRLEQRIGRLDRAGRPSHKPVKSVVMEGPLALEQALIHLHREVLEVYTRSVGGLEFGLPRFHQSILRAAAFGAEVLQGLEEPLREAVQEERQVADDAFRRALDATGPQLERANQLASLLSEEHLDESYQSLVGWARLMEMKTSCSEPGVYEYSWDWEHLKRPTSALSADGRIPKAGKRSCQGTYSRETALGNESLQFFGPGHQLIDAILHDVRHCDEGRATVLARNLGPDYQGKILLVVLGRCQVEPAGLPSGLLARAQRHLWPEPVVELFVLDTNEPADSAPLEDAALRAKLLSPEVYSRFRKIAAGKVAKMMPQMIEAVRVAVPKALRVMSTGRLARRADACTRLADELRQEMEYYRWLGEHEPQRAPFARGELADRQLLLERVRDERIELEGLALVIGTQKD
ncbi:MAG: SNF2-related protein [Vulcanimicrobiota bacterium]